MFIDYEKYVTKENVNRVRRAYNKEAGREFRNYMMDHQISDEFKRIIERIENAKKRKAEEKRIEEEKKKKEEERLRKAEERQRKAEERKQKAKERKERKKDKKCYLINGKVFNREIHEVENTIPLIKNSPYYKGEFFEIPIGENRRIYKKTDMLLTMLELAYNRKYYKLLLEPTYSRFWVIALSVGNISRIFKKYHPESLRKFFIYLSDKAEQDPNHPQKKICKKIPPLKLKEFIIDNKAYINKSKFKLGAIVNAIKECIIQDKESIQEFLEQEAKTRKMNHKIYMEFKHKYKK